jgi:hypothetical protein
VLLEVAFVEHKVKNFTFEYMDRVYTYEDVCARWRGKCYETATTKMLKIIDEVERNSSSASSNTEPIDWPIFVSPEDFDFLIMPESLGSPTLVNNETGVVAAKAMKSTFYLRGDGEFSINLYGFGCTVFYYIQQPTILHIQFINKTTQ